MTVIVEDRRPIVQLDDDTIGHIAAGEVVERPADQSFVDVLKAHSKDAGLVFLGLPDVPDGDEETFAEVFAPLIQNMPPTALVRNAGPFRGHLLQ